MTSNTALQTHTHNTVSARSQISCVLDAHSTSLSGRVGVSNSINSAFHGCCIRNEAGGCNHLILWFSSALMLTETSSRQNLLSDSLSNKSTDAAMMTVQPRGSSLCPPLIYSLLPWGICYPSMHRGFECHTLASSLPTCRVYRSAAVQRWHAENCYSVNWALASTHRVSPGAKKRRQIPTFPLK